MTAWYGKSMKRVVLRGCLYVGEAVYTARGLSLHEGSIAEIDLSGDKPVAWVNGEGFELSTQG